VDEVREQDKGKFGFPRQEDDAAMANEANRLNNADPEPAVPVNGRCPYDGLPAGNCAHLPGAQGVIAPDGSTVYEENYAAATEKAAPRQGGGKEPRKG
jgi:hypothetical protein